MKRKYECGSELNPIPTDPKRTRSPAQFKLKPHHQKKHKSGDLLGGGEEERDHDNDKEKDTSASALDSLPLELKLDILTRLPAKSVTKFRCVSKMWSSITRGPDFVRSFFSVSSTRPRLIVALSNGIDKGSEESLVFFFSFSPRDRDGYNFSSLVPNFEMAIPSENLSDLSGSCTSVHGLLTFRSASRLRICNPSMEQFIKLPNITTTFVGYDPVHDQYKAFSFYNTRALGTSDDELIVHKVFTFGQDRAWRRLKSPTTTPYAPVSVGLSIDGFVYYGAYTPVRHMNPGIMCFDVRSEKLTYIKAPLDILRNGDDGTFIEYKGKLASIVVANPQYIFYSFDLWILQDITKQEWSKTTFVVHPRVWDLVGGVKISFPGTNKAGEIILAPTMLSRDVRPFYIFYYSVETRKIIRVTRLGGIGDNLEFRRSYGFEDDCHVRIAPQHIESIGFLENTITVTNVTDPE